MLSQTEYRLWQRRIGRCCESRVACAANIDPPLVVCGGEQSGWRVILSSQQVRSFGWNELQMLDIFQQGNREEQAALGRAFCLGS